MKFLRKNYSYQLGGSGGINTRLVCISLIWRTSQIQNKVKQNCYRPWESRHRQRTCLCLKIPHKSNHKKLPQIKLSNSAQPKTTICMLMQASQRICIDRLYYLSIKVVQMCKQMRKSNQVNLQTHSNWTSENKVWSLKLKLRETNRILPTSS